jgi:hypothetical protein
VAKSTDILNDIFSGKNEPFYRLLLAVDRTPKVSPGEL